MKNRKRTCNVYDCTNEPHSGGLCKKHYKEESFKHERRERAIQTLHIGTIDDHLPVDKSLGDELSRLCKWWDRACLVLQTNRGTELIPTEEAQYALEWCISLAQEIIDAEIAIRSGKKVSISLNLTREWVWNRFKNLEAGLASNGLKRNIYI
jgi:hypothetical protein